MLCTVFITFKLRWFVCKMLDAIKRQYAMATMKDITVSVTVSKLLWCEKCPDSSIYPQLKICRVALLCFLSINTVLAKNCCGPRASATTEGTLFLHPVVVS